MPLQAYIKKLCPVLLVLFAAAVALGAYLQAIDFQFVSDDVIYIVDNHKLADLPISEVWRLLIERYNEYEFLPVRDFSYWLDMSMFGLNPAAFRLHNILLYVLCLPVVYLVTSGLWRYFRQADATNAPWIAAVVTALFTINPAHVESVVWASGRKDILAGLFSLLAINFAIKARQETGIRGSYAAASVLAFVVAMLSKATAVAVAPIVAILWVLFWLDISPKVRKLPTLVWPVFILLLAASMASIFAANSTIREPAEFDAGSVDRALTVTGNLARMAVSPEARHYFYSGLDDPFHVVMAVLGAAILVSAVAGGFMVLRRRSLAGMLLLIFVLLCVPYMQFIPYRTPSLVVDRYLFLAILPATLLLVSLAWRFKPVVRNSLLVIFALLWAQQTVERPRDWFSADTIIEADVKIEPGYFMPLFQKIMWLQLKRGEYLQARETAGRIDDPEIRNNVVALVESKYSLLNDPATADHHFDEVARLKQFETAMGRLSSRSLVNPSVRYVWKYSRFELVDQWKFLAGLYPQNIPIRLRTGRLIMYIDLDFAAAVPHLRLAAESGSIPSNMRGGVHRELGMALIYSGQLKDGESALRRALDAPQPDLQANCLLEQLYTQIGRSKEAFMAGAACPKYAQLEVAAN